MLVWYHQPAPELFEIPASAPWEQYNLMSMCPQVDTWRHKDTQLLLAPFPSFLFATPLLLKLQNLSEALVPQSVWMEHFQSKLRFLL